MTHAMTSLLVVLALAVLPCSFGVPAHPSAPLAIFQELLSPVVEQGPGGDNVLDRIATGPATQTASFDELLDILPLHQVPTPYQSLRFASWSVSPLKPLGDELEPHSAPNRAEHGMREQLSSFDLHSFWFGCTTNTAVTITAKAVPCSIEVTGTKADGGATVAPIALGFDPDLAVLDNHYDMAEGTFTNMTRLSKAVVTLLKPKSVIEEKGVKLMRVVIYVGL
ncbi:MAG: hypothetical protein M1826_003324 [Phylliscum demangeonii]|nr:MAG: hypothetical protein M1826_003324 [Phylliscum demangeonii]